MSTPIVLATIAGGAIAFIFFLIGMKKHKAERKRFLISKDDQFTGTWRKKGGLTGTGQLIIKPTNNGLSFQRSMNEKPLVVKYGKEFEDNYPFLERMKGLPPIMATVVRVDDHTLEFTYMDDGKLVLKSIYAVSSDGKHLKVSWEYPGRAGKSALYDRVGTSHEGDAFWGTWQSPMSK